MDSRPPQMAPLATRVAERRFGGRITAQVADMTDLPFAAESFDAV